MVSLDQEDPNDIRDNIMYYIGGYLVARMAAKVSCSSCKLLLFLNPSDPQQHTTNVPKYALLTARKQEGGLTFPSAPVLQIIKTTEVIFRYFSRLLALLMSQRVLKNIISMLC